MFGLFTMSCCVLCFAYDCHSVCICSLSALFFCFLFFYLIDFRNWRSAACCNLWQAACEAWPLKKDCSASLLKFCMLGGCRGLQAGRRSTLRLLQCGVVPSQNARIPPAQLRKRTRKNRWSTSSPRLKGGQPHGWETNQMSFCITHGRAPNCWFFSF